MFEKLSSKYRAKHKSLLKSYNYDFKITGVDYG